MNHAEAYHLMKYVCGNGHSEIVWNSRDGVTPLAITCQTCRELAYHVEWNANIYDPEYKVQIGERFFRDITFKEARKIARQIRTEQEVPFQSKYNSLAKEIYGNGHNPTIDTFKGE